MIENMQDAVRSTPVYCIAIIVALLGIRDAKLAGSTEELGLSIPGRVFSSLTMLRWSSPAAKRRIYPRAAKAERKRSGMERDRYRSDR